MKGDVCLGGLSIQLFFFHFRFDLLSTVVPEVEGSNLWSLAVQIYAGHIDAAFVTLELVLFKIFVLQLSYSPGSVSLRRGSLQLSQFRLNAEARSAILITYQLTRQIRFFILHSFDRHLVIMCHFRNRCVPYLWKLLINILG